MTSDTQSPKSEIDQSEELIPVSVMVVILITAYFLMDLGLAEIVKFIGQFFFKIELDEPPALLNFILIPVGVGLLRRQSAQRGCVLWIMGLLFIGTVFSAFLWIYVGSLEIPPDSYNMRGLVTATFVALGAAISWWSIKRYKSYFSSDLDDPIQGNSTALIWVFMLISIFANSISLIANQNSEEKLKSVFYLSAKVYAYDAETKQAISVFSVHEASGFGNSARNKIFTSYASEALGGTEVDYLVLSGLVFGQYSFGIQGRGSKNEGYVEKKVVINKDTPDEVLIYLEPTRTKNNKSE